jgi:predicted ATPase
MIFLRSIERQSGEQAGYTSFPFPIPRLLALRQLEFTAPVTFFVGENGTGRSTLLEAIALRAKIPCAAGQTLEHDPSLAGVHPLARSLRLTWRPRTQYGFVLRPEDFFDFVRENRKREKNKDKVAPQSPEHPQRGYTLVRKSSAKNRFEDAFISPTQRTSFMEFFRTHTVPGGLHLIDEPEAALSPQAQLEFLAHLKSLVAANAQFIIATHSPVLLAYPEAQILCFDSGEIRPIAYSEIPHVKFMRHFLQEPDEYLRKL